MPKNKDTLEWRKSLKVGDKVLVYGRSGDPGFATIAKVSKTTVTTMRGDRYAISDGHRLPRDAYFIFSIAYPDEKVIEEVVLKRSITKMREKIESFARNCQSAELLKEVSDLISAKYSSECPSGVN